MNGFLRWAPFIQGDVHMRGLGQQTTASGYLWNVLMHHGVTLADHLSYLSDEAFERTIQALRLYRVAVRRERAASPPALRS